MESKSKDDFNFCKYYYAIDQLNRLRIGIVKQAVEIFKTDESGNYFDKAFARCIFNINSMNNLDCFYPKNIEIMMKEIDQEIENYCKSENIPNKNIKIDLSIIDEVQKNIKEEKYEKYDKINIVVKSKNGSTIISFKFLNSDEMDITSRQYNRLRNSYNGDFKKINQCSFILIYLYYSLGNTNHHLSMPTKFINDFGIQMELFGSPLNTFTEGYCSAFHSIDKYFGSSGSFFNFRLIPNTIYTADPPYDDQLMTKMAKHIDQAFNEVKDITFIVLLPVWDKESQIKLGEKSYDMDFPAFDILSKSKHLVNKKMLNKKTSVYYDYFNNIYTRPTATHILLLSNCRRVNINLNILVNNWVKLNNAIIDQRKKRAQ